METRMWTVMHCYRRYSTIFSRFVYTFLRIKKEYNKKGKKGCKGERNERKENHERNNNKLHKIGKRRQKVTCVPAW